MLTSRDDASAHALRILLAEDDDEMRDLLGAALRAEGWEVDEARDGGEMLRQVREAYTEPMRAPDVIVMDVRMPKVSGLGLLAAIRRARWKTPIILITGFGDTLLHEQAAALGADVVLDKPFELELLITSVARVARSTEEIAAPVTAIA